MNLVTGATGFIGSHVLYRLAKLNRPVRALYRNTEKIKHVKRVFGYMDHAASELLDRITWVQGDVSDYQFVMDCMKDVSWVYHVAGLVSHTRKGVRAMEQVNVKGTENIVNACLEQNAGKLCHVSSIAALGISEDGQMVDESVLWQPGISTSQYALTKYRGEMEVWRGIYEGLQAVIVNPSLVIGPGMWLGPGAPLFTRVYKGLSFYPEGSCGYVDVRDVAEIMIKLMDSGIAAERFILNTDNLKHRDFINLVADAMHKKRPYIPVNPFIIKMACIAEKFRSLIAGTSPIITKQALETAAASISYSNQKIVDALEVDFIPVHDSVQHSARIFLAEMEQR